ncbi:MULTISPECIES: alpha/beta hydrolase [Carnobacterium]|nr:MULTISPECIES: alpha/beta hydrolase [Carnobacterium]MDT1939009.1 alpha/beta hydrolase [Carnobacterium divergens]MDT1941447.1 alpha/beta hydrolase [Carnobacterium divergens]MDT1947245.1 alpha/beta hydrolase [Carnobacterium divergens]MDT1949683.1 alpha/beta hydrolase [Carnobacterium divergens]MDT1954861.1 alpha/beta hydrolase [Carnobacterium divergens]
MASYQESIITGKQTGHSDLLDNSKVQNQVKAFIYQDEN